MAKAELTRESSNYIKILLIKLLMIARALEILKMEELEIRVELGIGNEEAKMWTCDFSYDYIKINADYRT
ncbi:hypothetical protein Glove_682g31 [Diversispora epigaea]|uniref:Uncharacterized protein n=1 Tax=Diversispora epigaea TaxID=1348612 RepID=A0A397G8Q5_9GLOM|nr:hypothetical protein Glove_682g31 [Diversispora epigaea]